MVCYSSMWLCLPFWSYLDQQHLLTHALAERHLLSWHILGFITNKGIWTSNVNEIRWVPLLCLDFEWYSGWCFREDHVNDHMIRTSMQHTATLPAPSCRMIGFLGRAGVPLVFSAGTSPSIPLRSQIICPLVLGPNSWTCAITANQKYPLMMRERNNLITLSNKTLIAFCCSKF